MNWTLDAEFGLKNQAEHRLKNQFLKCLWSWSFIREKTWKIKSVILSEFSSGRQIFQHARILSVVGLKFPSSGLFFSPTLNIFRRRQGSWRGEEKRGNRVKYFSFFQTFSSPHPKCFQTNIKFRLDYLGLAQNYGIVGYFSRSMEKMCARVCACLRCLQCKGKALNWKGISLPLLLGDLGKRCVLTGKQAKTEVYF